MSGQETAGGAGPQESFSPGGPPVPAGQDGLPAEVGDATDLSASVDLLAAALRADAGDLASYERVFLGTFADALPPGIVEVDRDRSLSDRMAGRPGRPVAIRVRLGDQVLELASGRGAPVASVAKAVRGVTISRREVTVAEWSQALAAALARFAAEHAETRAALGRLLGAG